MLLLLAAPGFGAEDKPSRPDSEPPARVETHHAITLAGRALGYRAVAETIGLTTQKGEPSASIFTVSYLADPAADSTAAAPRPVAFVFNGGPGAAAVFLHLGALGPRILETGPRGAVPEPPVRLTDNEATWLAFTDLVFIDPVGTGFSRGKGKEDNPDKPFWNVRADLNELGAVVRRWLTRNGRWASPVFLVGESYGGLRAAALSHTLVRDNGIVASGLVLVSPALDIAMLHPDISNILAPAMALPSYAASSAALDAKDPEPAAAAAETFALSDYLVGIAGVTGIPAPGDPFIARIARLIGLPEEVVRRERGRVSGQTFARERRRAAGEILSQYDATIARPTIANPWDDHAGDAVLDASVAAFTSAFETYVSGELGYHTEQPYRVLARDVSQQWDWDAARDQGGIGLALDALEKTLLSHPATKLLVATGRYDLVTPYFASQWLIDQLSLPQTLRDAVKLRVYPGGHMMYLRPASRTALAADAAPLFAAPSR